MKRILSLVAAGLFAAAPLWAQQPPAERIHVVRPGDTLWDLARTYLNDPFLWPDIFRLNPNVVQDPARIYPAERLLIPGAGEGAQIQIAGESGRSIFFPRDLGAPREAGPRIRAAGTADVPVITPGDFYGAGILAQESEIATVGRVVGTLAPSVVPTRLEPLIGIYDKIFVQLADPGAVAVGDRLHFFREGERVKPYGRVFNSTGIATIAAIEGNTATAVVVRLYDAVAIGDVAVPVAEFPVAAGVSPEPAAQLDGRLVAFATEHPLQSTKDVGFVDLGTQAGVDEGDEFIAFLPPERRKGGWTRPAVEVARLQVVRVTDRTATVRVTDLKYPALEEGMPIRQISKMPG